MITKIFYISAIAFCLTNCSDTHAPLIKKNETKKIITLSDSIKNKIDPKIKISVKEENKIDTNYTIKVVFSNTYCGGAWPTQEIIDSYEHELPLKNSTILLKELNGNSKPIKVSTDSKGFIHTNLKPATYKYFMTKTYCKTMGADFNPYDSISMYRCYGKIIITKNKTYDVFFKFNNCGLGNRP